MSIQLQQREKRYPAKQPVLFTAEQVEAAVQEAIGERKLEYEREIRYLKDQIAVITELWQDHMRHLCARAAGDERLSVPITQVQQVLSERPADTIATAPLPPDRSPRPPSPPLPVHIELTEKKMLMLQERKERTLDVLASSYPRGYTKRNLAVLIGTSSYDKEFTKHLQELISAGSIMYVETELSFTEKGLAEYRPDTEVPPTSPIVLGQQRLSGQRLHIFTLLTEIYPQALTVAQIAEQGGFPNDNTLSENITYLHRIDLVTLVGGGQVKAAEILFRKHFPPPTLAK